MYYINVDYRKGGSYQFGGSETFEEACQKLKEHLIKKSWTEEEILRYKEFGSNVAKGTFYSEDESYDVLEMRQ